MKATELHINPLMHELNSTDIKILLANVTKGHKGHDFFFSSSITEPLYYYFEVSPYDDSMQEVNLSL